jgi:hypothetical protein
MNLSFVRHKTVVQHDNIYASSTDVWVYGDVEGYLYWIELLKASAAGYPACRIDQKVIGMYSMSLVLQQRVRHRDAIVDLSERLFHRPDPVMELVVNATTAGYRKMLGEVQTFTEKLNDDPDDHIHLDRHVPWLTGNSISLNIRGPMKLWNPARALALGPRSWSLPDGWLDKPYADQEENLKLPEPVKFRQRWCRR